MAEMDIERFVEAPGRAEKIKQVREMIDSMGIEYLYLQFVSVTGKIMGKGYPPIIGISRYEGFQLVYGATVNLFTDRAGNYLGMVRKRQSWWEYQSPKHLCNYRGRRKLVVFIARYSATARKKQIRGHI